MASPHKQISFIEDCYSLYEQKMYRVAYSILHDESLAEDAVQDAFLKLIDHKVHFDEADSDDCKRYIITVIRNASINIYNKRKNENKIVSLSDKVEEMGGSYTPSPEIEQDTGAECTPLMKGLPDKYYDIVYCLVIKEYTVRETASKLNLTEANVRKRFERAKKMMRKSFDQAKGLTQIN